ncbi:MAG: 50S ribosomal protein L18 [Bacteroidetes bacterium]|nr:50S ribosomal protein L18 [Bacteroidota bacterium]
MALNKHERRMKIKRRVGKNISGTPENLRMSVFRSNRQISVQLINDLTGQTVVSASSLCKEVADKKGVAKSEQARLVGKLIAERALSAGISSVVFDRSGYLYHGRIKALADAAREGGLKF